MSAIKQVVKNVSSPFPSPYIQYDHTYIFYILQYIYIISHEKFVCMGPPLSWCMMHGIITHYIFTEVNTVAVII